MFRIIPSFTVHLPVRRKSILMQMKAVRISVNILKVLNDLDLSSTLTLLKSFVFSLNVNSPIIVRRIVYSKGGHSIKNKVNLLIKLVSLKMNREEGPAPGSTWRFLIFG